MRVLIIVLVLVFIFAIATTGRVTMRLLLTFVVVIIVALVLLAVAFLLLALVFGLVSVLLLIVFLVLLATVPWLLDMAFVISGLIPPSVVISPLGSGQAVWIQLLALLFRLPLLLLVKPTFITSGSVQVVSKIFLVCVLIEAVRIIPDLNLDVDALAAPDGLQVDDASFGDAEKNVYSSDGFLSVFLRDARLAEERDMAQDEQVCEREEVLRNQGSVREFKISREGGATRTASTRSAPAIALNRVSSNR
jgi:hypothetical protein